MTAVCAVAGGELSLKSILSGEFRSESMTAVTPLAGGDTYAQISDDGKRIVAYSYKTGKQTAVLFDAEDELPDGGQQQDGRKEHHHHLVGDETDAAGDDDEHNHKGGRVEQEALLELFRLDAQQQ